VISSGSRGASGEIVSLGVLVGSSLTAEVPPSLEAKEVGVSDGTLAGAGAAATVDSADTAVSAAEVGACWGSTPDSIWQAAATSNVRPAAAILQRLKLDK
ncbi:MAG: hypothetical protein OXD31_03665, partial [Chloroflexi bacterium]|nr:hypothetical protein [Chloroflexota bacterium]